MNFKFSVYLYENTLALLRRSTLKDTFSLALAADLFKNNKCFTFYIGYMFKWCVSKLHWKKYILINLNEMLSVQIQTVPNSYLKIVTLLYSLITFII